MLKRSYLALLAAAALSGCFVEPDPVDETGNDTTGDDTTDGTTGDSGPAELTDESSGGADTTTGEPVDVCPEYCGLVQDICVDDLQQYTSEEICLGVCNALPPGAADDQLGNTAGCRRFQAVQAAEAPDVFCGPAGPTGANTCGASCESFCSLATTLCVGDNEQWPDVPSCIADCMMFTDDVEYNASVVSGDSYACRMYHLTVAALDPGVHCPHIPLDSPVCL